jgi:acyl-CoA synthetase (AMP-forming)/AMP-acid ligase II
MREINRNILHMAYTPPSADIGAAEIDRWHKDRGWSGIGYHFVIRRSGENISAVEVETVLRQHPAILDVAVAATPDAIRGDGPTPGSNFDYAADLTEAVLVGVIAQRFGGRIEYDAANMKFPNRPELDTHLRIHAREGWRYGIAD